MNKPPLGLMLAAVVAVAACGRPDQDTAARELVSRVLKGTLIYPGSTVLGVSAGSEAAELRMGTPEEAHKVADWLRTALSLNHWELEHDAVNRDGSIVIYAKQGPRPLWITLTPNTGGPGTTYTMIGALVEGDSIR